MATLKTPVGDQDHVQGNAKAKCTLLEYGDYECPHCGAAYPLDPVCAVTVLTA